MSAAVRILAQALLGLCGAALLLPGIYLAGLGGSPYYLFAGAALLLAAVLLYRGQRAGLHVFLLLLGATLAWSVWEAGFDGWALMPRLVFPLLLALLVWPASRGALKSGGAALRLSRRVSYGAVGLAVLLTSAWAALGVCALGHVLDKGGFDRGAQGLVHGFAAFFVLPRPTGFGDGRDIHKTCFERLGMGRRRNKGRKRKKAGGRECGCEVFIHGSPLHGSG